MLFLIACFITEQARCLDMGDHIVVGGDFNDSVFADDVVALLELFDMHNLIFECHDPSDAPKTYFRTSDGRVIDGLWGTPGVEVERCGHLVFLTSDSTRNSETGLLSPLRWRMNVLVVHWLAAAIIHWHAPSVCFKFGFLR